MFNKTTSIRNTHNTTVTPVTRVIEKSITPDKVTDMYDKVHEEVEKTILRKIVIDDNYLKGSIITIVEPDNNSHRVILRFTLNGKEHIFSETINSRSAIAEGKEFVFIMMERLSKQIVEDMTHSSIKDSVKILK